MLFIHLFLSSSGGRFGNILRYVAVVVNTTLTGPTLKYTEGLQASKKWEEYMEQEVRDFDLEMSYIFLKIFLSQC